ncbi:MAG: hypothetical protein ACI8V5_001525, partial [Limisphaerales bacterium]
MPRTAQRELSPHRAFWKSPALFGIPVRPSLYLGCGEGDGTGGRADEGAGGMDFLWSSMNSFCMAVNFPESSSNRAVSFSDWGSSR